MITHSRLRTAAVADGRARREPRRRRLHREAAPAEAWAALRLATAFVAPIAVGLAVERLLTGLLVGIGAFMVANADLGESFPQRLRLMAPATLGIAALTAAGMAAAAHLAVAVVVGAVVFALAGWAASFGREASLFGTFLAFAYVIGTGLAVPGGPSIAAVGWPMLAGGALAMLLSAANLLVVGARPDEPPEPWASLLARARARTTVP